MQITIDGATLIGAGIGAATMMVPVLGQCLLATAGRSMISLGGFDFPWREFRKASRIYAPLGAAVGVVTVVAGAPVWAACPVTAGVASAIILTYRRRSNLR